MISAILSMYIKTKLHLTEDVATTVYTTFSMMVYFTCIFGGIISDNWLGKFRTILYLSIVYAIGSIVVAIGAIPTVTNSPAIFLYIGLVLIGVGSGGIKPCVSAFGGDQFQLPAQAAQMTKFFSIFYFSINAGSLLSTAITPNVRDNVHCFGDHDCYSLAFGIPAILMIISIGKTNIIKL